MFILNNETHLRDESLQQQKNRKLSGDGEGQHWRMPGEETSARLPLRYTNRYSVGPSAVPVRAPTIHAHYSEAPAIIFIFLLEFIYLFFVLASNQRSQDLLYRLHYCAVKINWSLCRRALFSNRANRIIVRHYTYSTSTSEGPRRLCSVSDRMHAGMCVQRSSKRNNEHPGALLTRRPRPRVPAA